MSALWSENGNVATIIKLLPNIITPCFSYSIFLEYVNVLNRPKFDFSARKKELLLSKIKEYGEVVSADKSDIPMADESDRIFYDTAKASGAILITGNTKHYPAEPFIMNPAVFLERFERSGSRFDILQ